MTDDDLLTLLDLGGTDVPAKAEPALAISGGDVPPAGAGPTALEVDEWGLRRGRDLLNDSERFRRLALDEYAAADFHAAAFDPEPRLTPACRDGRRRDFVAALLETPDYRALHAATQLDDAAACIAAVAFAEQFQTLAGRDEAGSTPEVGDSDIATLRAVGRAVAEADAEVCALHETTAALGLGPGTAGTNDPKAVAVLFRRVRSDPVLRRIVDLAGRYRRVAQSKQRQKAGHGLDDVVGVELGGDVGRLLPSELARLALPEFEWDALRRIAERQALCREWHASEPVGKGPVVVCVDESGSMEGAKAHAAKALALAMAWVARRQRRWCGLAAYSGDTGERLLALPPHRWDEAKLVDWLAAFLGGGSTLDVPVRELPRMVRELSAPVGVTDAVFLTDAQCSIPAAVRAAFLAWKRSARAWLISFVVGGDAGDLTAVSDEVHLVRTLDPGGEAVGRVLSM